MTGMTKGNGKSTVAQDVPTIDVHVSEMQAHPDNYKKHPDDQLAHIAEGMKRHGAWKNVVLARGNVILAGHGVWMAAQKIGRETLPAKLLDIDPKSAAAKKILAGDNEIGNLAETDDRALANILKTLSGDGDLLGSGFDEKQLAMLAFVTRNSDEIGDIDEAAAWVGMPSFAGRSETFNVILLCDSAKHRDALIRKIGVTIPGRKEGRTWSYRYPPRSEKQDIASLRVVDGTKKKKPKKAA